MSRGQIRSARIARATACVVVFAPNFGFAVFNTDFTDSAEHPNTTAASPIVNPPSPNARNTSTSRRFNSVPAPSR